MNFLKRAYLNVTRKWSKSLLLALTFFVIGNFVIVGLGISSASENAKDLTRQKMRAVVEFKADWQAFYEYADTITDDAEREAFYKKGIEGLNFDAVTKMLADPRVKIANALYSNTNYAVSFEYVPLNNKAEENYKNNNTSGGGAVLLPDGSSNEYVWTPPSISVQGNPLPDMIEFADGMFILKEGRMYSQEEIDNKANVVLITQKLAEYNNLRIGDTITFSAVNPSDVLAGGYMEGMPEENYLYECEIIGIFENTAQLDPSSSDYQWMDPWQNPDNVILAPRSTLVEKQYQMSLFSWDKYKELYPNDEYYSNPENQPTYQQVDAYNKITILLNDPLDVDSFVEEYQASAPDFTVFDANNDTFKALAKPLDTMSLFANFIVWLVIINAVIIITLITALTLKTREYEIGVLLSMGVSKLKIVSQFFAELALIAIIGFTAAVLSGSLISKQIGNAVLNYQISISDEVKNQDDNFVYWGETNYFTEVTLEDIVSEYEVNISPWIIGQIYIAGLGIVFISIIIPSAMIMRFNPKRILMNTN